jgi:SAM-dependent methyltransferase
MARHVMSSVTTDPPPEPRRPPVPPGDPSALKCQCAEVWSNPAAQLLLGPALRPGGAEVTSRLLSECGLRPGAVVLDVGCGPGATLEAITASGQHGVGVDYSAALARAAASPASPAVVGDAECLPIKDGCADAAAIECVLSAVPDKARALDELYRVVRADGALILTDMTLAAEFPEPLNTALAWVACAAGALSSDGYGELLEAHGFAISATEDRSPDLAAMVAKARRRLALFRGAAGVGLLPSLEELIGPDLSALAATVLGHTDVNEGARHVLAQIDDAVDEGAMGYVAITAIRH